MSIFSGSDRIEMLGYDIIHLISLGYKEDFSVIIEKLEHGSLINYLYEKYRDDLCFVSFEKDSPYNPLEWEKVLDEYSYLDFHHDVVRKMGIENKSDGLLVILNIILDLVATRK